MNRLVLTFCLILLSGCSLPLTPNPTVGPPVGTCGYQWAYKELPELSMELQKALQELQPEAQARAIAFGEDCIYEDGQAVFTAMETDFTINIYGMDLSDEDELGGWIVKTMQIIGALDAEKLVGPKPGKVTIDFHSGDTEKFVNFYKDRYDALPAGLSNAEIFQALETAP
jgi:hypothetical protein